MQKAAPTGTAAFLIGGETLHSMFRIPVQGLSTKKELDSLKDGSEELRERQQLFKNVELLVIDEKSMMGVYTMYILDKRLRQFKCKDAPFGGLSIILLGDYTQLPPVGDAAVYTTKTDNFSLQQAQGSMLYSQTFNKTIILDESMRQQGEENQPLRDVLLSLRNGKFTLDQWKSLKSKELSVNGIESKEERERFMENGVMLCAFNRDLVNYNKRRIQMLGNPIAKYKSENSSATVAALPATTCKGLPAQNWLCKGSKVLLTTNLWKEAGLTNKAEGTVRYIVYEGSNEPPDMPSFVVVEFPNYIGPGWKGMKNCVPIPIKRFDWMIGKKQVYRRMIPLIPAYSRSIHSSQGQTIRGPVIINLGKKEFAVGLTYTAISRVTDWNNLSFLPVRPYNPRWTSYFRSKAFQDRMAHDKKEQLADEKFDDINEFEQECDFEGVEEMFEEDFSDEVDLSDEEVD